MIPAWARALVTLTLLALLFWLLPVDLVWAAMTRVRPVHWLLGFALLVAGQGLAALKWRLLVRAAGSPASFIEVLQAHQAGLLSNAFLPSVVGGDVVRLGVLARRSSSETVVASGLADRALDAGSLLLLPAVAAVALPAAVPGARGPLVKAALVLACLAALALITLLVLRWLPLPERLSGFLSRLRGAFGTLLSRPRTALLAAALSIVVQSLFVLVNSSLGAQMGIAIPLAGWFLAWPLAKLVALLPVSLGGIGVREAALASLLLPLGVDPSLAVGQSLLWASMLIAQALLAGLLVPALRSAPSRGGKPAADGSEASDGSS